ncbi:hypothetical protein [Streptomyces africanus]|uniref:hypothetical protein n=1 Tax=Streptomyces africanus TaxID=231024 RepID=UPI0027D8AFB8|nr:hypothetical protein [Streptomyces africanus]
MALPPVPPFAAAASTVRVPAGLTTALRRTTADLRQRLAKGRRPTDPTRAGAGDMTAVPGLTGTGAMSAVVGLTSPGDVSDILGLTGGPAPGAQHRANADRVGDADRSGRTDRPGRAGRPWADLARSYLTLVLTRLPRPRRPAHTTITVYIATTAPLSERPTGSAPRHRRGQHGPGPEPDATP